MDLLQELEKLENEKQQLVGRWGKTGLLREINNEEIKSNTAVLLENQRLYNEMNADRGDEAQFKRVSIPLVRRVVPNLAAWEFVSVQPLLMKTDSFYYFRGNQLIRESVVAKEHKTKCHLNYEAIQDLRSVHNIDAEAELCAVLALELSLWHDRRILSDLREGAATKHQVDFNNLYGDSYTAKCETLRLVIENLAVEVNDVSNKRFPTWLCASPELVEVIGAKKTDEEFANCLGIRKHGVLTVEGRLGDKEINVWVDGLAKMGQVTLGYRGEHPCDAGYTFCPHLMVKRGAVVLDPNSFVPRRPINSIYESIMIDPTCYGMLEVSNFFLEGV